ncbi:MAG: TonB-dependent receptor [Flavobacteriales bacterium]|nr:TonB-dependent receptor [Flavobacteriales bacterium]
MHFNKLIYFFTLIFISPLAILGQEINGIVLDDKNQPLINASVYFINSTSGAITNKNGFFKINFQGIQDSRLITSYIGFKNDTTDVVNQNSIVIRMIASGELNSIDVKENKTGSYIDKESVIKNEIITPEELTKAACCDLAGCFETQSSVHSKTSNVITNSKELSLLGLSGTYNQILIDDHPIVEASSYTYGISAIPGSLIQKITISQGLASVLQGPESISGRINILLKEHNLKNKFFINLYCNSFLARQLNFDYSYKIGNWKNITAIHTTQPSNKIDENNDNFLDVPQTTKYSIYHKWEYGNKNEYGLYNNITFRYMDEERNGGTIDYNKDKDKGSNSIYGQHIDFSQSEINIKTSYMFNSGNNIYHKSAFSLHDQNSYFGSTQYLANQQHYIGYLAYIHNWNNHKLNTGIDFKKLDLEEILFFDNTLFNIYDQNLIISNGIFNKNETRNGIFIENTFKWKNNIELLSGFRIDLYNTEKLYYSPRMLIKYDVTENSTLRMSLGKGWRPYYAFSEHVHLFGSYRDIVISNDLQPEEGVNFGSNFIQNLSYENFDIQFTIDFYKTIFSNHITEDYERDLNKIYIDNFNGKTISNSMQLEVGLNFGKSTAFKIGYNYLDVFRIYENHKHDLPFVSNHILTTMSYQPIQKKWSFDINAHWFGEKKIYNISNNPNDPYNGNYFSQPYTIINCQFTQRINDLELYLGCENIFDFMQSNPIINWEDPFSDYFMTSNNWGPTKGREFYCGLRLGF